MNNNGEKLSWAVQEGPPSLEDKAKTLMPSSGHIESPILVNFCIHTKYYPTNNIQQKNLLLQFCPGSAPYFHGLPRLRIW